jgi:hypothetical protein
MTSYLTPRQHFALNLTAFIDPGRIEESAYYKWENRGRPECGAVDDWLEAEKELQDHLYGNQEPLERNLGYMSFKPDKPISGEQQEQGSK